MELPVGESSRKHPLLPPVLGAGSLANRGIAMAGILFILAVLFGGAALLFRNAAGEIAVGTP